MGECYFDGEEEVDWILRMVGKAGFDIQGRIYITLVVVLILGL